MAETLAIVVGDDYKMTWESEDFDIKAPIVADEKGGNSNMV